jgi:hypothetical protein
MLPLNGPLQLRGLIWQAVDGRGRSLALRRQKPAPQGFASAATVTSLFDRKSVCASRQTATAGGPNQTIKVGQMTISTVGNS